MDRDGIGILIGIFTDSSPVMGSGTVRSAGRSIRPGLLIGLRVGMASMAGTDLPLWAMATSAEGRLQPVAASAERAADSAGAASPVACTPDLAAAADAANCRAKSEQTEEGSVFADEGIDAFGFELSLLFF
jgi:hypothetical protein